MRKTAKYIGVSLLVLFTLILLLPFALYLPVVQSWAKDVVVSYTSSAFDMNVSVGRIQLMFPLNLVVENSSVITHSGDTVLYCEKLQADVALIPLFRKQIKVKQFSFMQAQLHYKDTVSQFEIGAKLGLLSLEADPIDLSSEIVSIPAIRLEEGSVRLFLGEGKPDTLKSDTSKIRWIFDVNRFTCRNIAFKMQSVPLKSDIDVKLGTGKIERARVDLGNQEILAQAVDIQNTDCSYLTDTLGRETTQKQPIDTTQSAPWIVKVTTVKLGNSRAIYGMSHYLPRKGFDPNYISVSNLNLSVDSVFNRQTEVKAIIRSLTFNERSGLKINELSGRLVMDSIQYSLQNFILKTPFSSVVANLSCGASITKMLPETFVKADLSAWISLNDFILLYPDIRMKTYGQIPAVPLRAETNLSGSLGHIVINQLGMSMFSYFDLSGTGQAYSVITPKKMNGNFRLKGNLERASFLADLFMDKQMKERLLVPNGIKLGGKIAVDGGVYRSDLDVALGKGSIKLSGILNSAIQGYDLTVNVSDFPFQQILPRDSIGVATFDLQAKGAGFDFFSSRTSSNLTMNIHRFYYKGYDYMNVKVDVLLKEHHLSGNLSSNSPALDFLLNLSGYLSKELYKAELSGDISCLDLRALNFMPKEFTTSMKIELKASATKDKSYQADLSLKDWTLKMNHQENKLESLSVQSLFNKNETDVILNSGDLSLKFTAPIGIDSLFTGITVFTDTINRQIREGHFNMIALKKVLPLFEFSVDAGNENILGSYLKMSGIEFKKMAFRSYSERVTPFRFTGTVDALTISGILLDTLFLNLEQDSSRLNYGMYLSNAPGNIDNLADLRMNGYLEDNRVNMHCLQKNRAGETGFDFGVNTFLKDSSVYITFFPEEPILGFEKWKINKNNFFEFTFGKKYAADVRLENGTKKMHVQSIDLNSEMKSGALAVNLKGIEIAPLLNITPFAPPVDGVLSSDLTLDFPQGRVDVDGSVSVENLSYEQQRLGNVDLSIHYKLDSLSVQHANVDLLIDKNQALIINGSYDTKIDKPIDLSLKIPSFPLSAVNPFLPPDMARLSGTLSGDFRLMGKPEKPLASGHLQFLQSSVIVPMIGTTFDLSDTKILVEENDIIFENYAIKGPNKKPLTINGHVNLRDFSRIHTDLSLNATDFQLVNVPQNKKSLVYGKVNIDMDASMKGPIDELQLRGNIGLLNGTEVTYVMRDSPLELKEQTNNMVTFVSFKDTMAVAVDDSIPRSAIWGMDMLVNIDIANAVKMAVNLSADGQNRINLQGGGHLTYTMNMLGDTRFSGRYELSGGTVRYNPPVISEKTFNIQQGGYVEWNGDMLDPALNITAVEPLKVNVTEDNNASRPVNFNVIINIRNTLENLVITFDVSAPEDLTIQNQLSSLTAEQRATQAMNLLIYNSYSTPGSAVKGSIAGNPLNSFIQKELNQWAQDNLKGVDLSFGINTADDQLLGGANSHTDYSYKLSKNLFDDRVRVIIGGSFRTDADPTENLKQNLIDDISLEYMLDKRDNMFIKLFRHTGYESILEGEITQTGVGFVVRKKLLNLGHLFRITSRKQKQVPQ